MFFFWGGGWKAGCGVEFVLQTNLIIIVSTRIDATLFLTIIDSFVQERFNYQPDIGTKPDVTKPKRGRSEAEALIKSRS